MVLHKSYLWIINSVALAFLLLFINCAEVESDEILGEEPNIVQLGALNVHKDAVTLSGFSAGASMATQMHIAHSSIIRGIAMFSQVFYRCGPTSLIEFGLRCSKTGLGLFPYKLENALQDVKTYESQNIIDPLSNLKNSRVYIWTGSSDEYIPAELARQNLDFYSKFISNPSSSIHLNVSEAKHLFPTTNFGNGCDEDASKNVYLGNCNFSGAHAALEFLLRDRMRVIMAKSDDADLDLAPLRRYNQSEFYKSGNIQEVAMGEVGFIYIPKKCGTNGFSREKCYLHFNFHGCYEWPPAIAEKYIRNNGFLPVAEANNVIIVFPLTTKVPQNYDGCWDFFSYTGNNFATKEGSQIKVIRAMIDRILDS